MGTKIAWTDYTWNPTTGCSKLSAGCAHCFAERMARRLAAMGKPGYTALPWTAANAAQNVALHPGRLGLPLRWREPRRIFVDSMSDLFHEQVPFEFIDSVWAAMALTPQHTYQILTKRPARMLEYFGRVQLYGNVLGAADGFRMAWPRLGDVPISNPAQFPLANVWLGVSVEDQRAADERIPLLLKAPAAVRFLSCEPLLGPVSLFGLRCGEVFDSEGAPYYDALSGYSYWGDGDFGIHGPGLHWVICGGESGPGARPMHPKWARDLLGECQSADVPFFFKQWGAWMPYAQWKLQEPVGHYAEWGALSLNGDWAPETTTWNGRQENPADDYEVSMVNVGKRVASCLLDNREWKGYPEVTR